MTNRMTPKQLSEWLEYRGYDVDFMLKDRTCKNCKWWERFKLPSVNAGHGICENLYGGGGHVQGGKNFIPPANFGCNLWEERDE